MRAKKFVEVNTGEVLYAIPGKEEMYYQKDVAD